MTHAWDRFLQKGTGVIMDTKVWCCLVNKNFVTRFTPGETFSLWFHDFKLTMNVNECKILFTISSFP